MLHSLEIVALYCAKPRSWNTKVTVFLIPTVLLSRWKKCDRSVVVNKWIWHCFPESGINSQLNECEYFYSCGFLCSSLWVYMCAHVTCLKKTVNQDLIQIRWWNEFHLAVIQILLWQSHISDLLLVFRVPITQDCRSTRSKHSPSMPGVSAPGTWCKVSVIACLPTLNRDL